MGEAQSRGARPGAAREGPGQAEEAAAEQQQQRPSSRELREPRRRHGAGDEDATGEADDGSASTTSTSSLPTSAGAEGAGGGGAGTAAEGESEVDDAAMGATSNVEASMSLASASGSTRNFADADEEDLMPLPLPPPLLMKPGPGDAPEGRDRGATLDENDVLTASESEDEDLDEKNARGILAHHNDSSSETSSTGSDDLAEDPNESYRRGIGAIPSMQETPPSWANDTEAWTRTIGLGDNATMLSNAVHTTKYTAMSFLPRSFLLQYRRAGNIFFTVIVVVMLLGTFSKLFDSPQAPWGNIFVLSVIFGLNMTSEYLDDRARARKDDETNAQPIEILDPVDRKFATKTWREVRRGDLLRLEKNAVCPADVLVLTTSDIDTELCCYVQTANIDGETYLKKRHCKKDVVDKIIMSPPETADWVEGREFRYEPPSSSLSSFRIVAMPKKGERRQEPLAFTSENVVLRGAQLRNTEWIFGVVLYTGNETKTLMSIAPARIKQSKVDRMVNQVIVTVLVMLVLLLGASILLSTYAYKPTTELWYMMFTPESSGNLLPSGLALILTYLVLYRQILPILLYAVQEGLNVAQAKYIGWDLNMYDEASGKFASCNTTSLAQEIGQVKWIFSDKTGTLTRNEMRLVAICINNRVYGRATNKQLEELAREKLSPLDASRSCFTDVLDVLASSSEPGEREKLQHFFTVLALCHTVLVESSSANHPIKDSTRLLRRSSLTARSGSIMHATTLESAVDADGVHVAKKKRSPNQRRLRMTLKSRKHASEVILQARQSEGFQSDLNEPSPDEADDSGYHEDDGNPSDPVPTYNAESPDEEALVLGACALGFEFAYTEGESTIGLRFRAPNLDSNRTTYANEPNDGPLQPNASGRNIYHFQDTASTRYQGYEVLAINPFTSDRKRMSVLYADPDNPGRRILFCKGADNQMLSAANPDTTDYDSIRANLKSFAENGLRTLIVGEREISDDEYRAWSKLHEEACALTGKERKARLDEVAQEIEVKLSILGLTAVEDRLQDGVPQTISILRAAKINIWLITGDKVETAINIGRSAELISQNSRVLMLTAEDLGISEEQQQKPSISPAQPENKRQGSSFAVEANGLALEDIQDRILDVVQDHLARMSSEDDGRHSRPSMSGIYAGGYQSYVMTRDNEERGISGFCMRLFSRRRGKTENVEADANLALVVDGDTLHYIMSKKHPNAALEAAFLQLARGCGVVIACRTSPGQKADLVELVKANVYPTPTTLAIGDGANDVPMIEKGHVGVGISGKEGTHAANAADFTIAQFKFLAPLLLVHGRFGYIRVAKAISLTFFANLLFTFVSFFYNFICRFSGTPAFNNAQYVIFQAFIAIPVFVIGWLDRDTKWVYDTLRNPRLYDIGRLNRILHPAIVDAQILRGLVHGAFAFLLVFYNDYEASYLALSGSLFVVITCVLTVRQASVASCYTWGLLFGVCFNIVGCLVLVSLINFFYSGSESNIFNLDKWGRYYWNQLVASVFIISLLDYLAPLTYTQMRDLITRFRLSLHKARQTVDEDPHDALFDGRLVGSPATAHPTSAAFLGPPMATELQSPSDLRPTTPRGPGLSVVSEGEAEASDLESVRSTQERDVVMRY